MDLHEKINVRSYFPKTQNRFKKPFIYANNKDYDSERSIPYYDEIHGYKKNINRKLRFFNKF